MYCQFPLEGLGNTFVCCFARGVIQSLRDISFRKIVRVKRTDPRHFLKSSDENDDLSTSELSSLTEFSGLEDDDLPTKRVGEAVL